MLNYNISYSAWSIYKQSQLQFYFQYVGKGKPSDEGMDIYGNAGNVVHKAIENYIASGEDTFDKFWNEYDVDNQTGFHGVKLDKGKFRTMYDNGVDYLRSVPGITAIKTEYKFEKEFFEETFKGYIDVVASSHEDEIVVYDWKTNSTDSYEMHKDQRLFYSWLMWKTANKIPKCKWVYLKNMVVHEDKFTFDEIIIFDRKMQTLVWELQKKSNDISKYEIGGYKNPFNKFYTLCQKEELERDNGMNHDITFAIRGNFVFLEGDIPRKLLQGIDFATKFDLPNKFWMQKQMRKKGGMFNLEDIGTVHLYNSKFKCFPIGLMDKVTEIIHEFGEYYGKKMKIFLKDCRNKTVLHYKTTNQFKESNVVLRDYQKEAVEIFIKKEFGIINIATGGGKTIIAAEIIKRANARVLWIIDRKELLEQTKAELEKYLGIGIGVIYDGQMEIKNITVATIQTLNSRLKDFEEYLGTVNFVVVDEYHKSATESYQKVFAKLPNTKYRLGLTATVDRDDGKTPILFSILGKIVYKANTQKLISLGYLVKPKIQFIKINTNLNGMKESYQDDYQRNVVDLFERNDGIVGIVRNNPDKKILILTKLVAHGKHLESLMGPNVKRIIGSTSREERHKIFNDFAKLDLTKVLIGTLSIFAEGIDIPDLDIIINAAGNKGDVKSIQVLGRVLRIFKGKSLGEYYDFVDDGYHTNAHSHARIAVFEEQGHEVKII